MLSQLRPLPTLPIDLPLTLALAYLIHLNTGSMIRALQYLTFTRPDLAFSVHQLCQFILYPTTTHLEAAKRVLRYVRGTLHFGIHLSPGPLILSAFSNAN